MTFCCEHTKKAHELITESINRIIGKSDKEPSSTGESIRTFIPFASLYDKNQLHSAIDDYRRWMSGARNSLTEAKKEADRCNCTKEEKKNVSDLNQRIQDKEKYIEFGKETLKRTTNQLQKSEEKREKLEIVEEQFNNLRVEDVRTREEVKKLREENEFLKKQLRESKEENLTQKIFSKEEKLNRLVFRLNIDDNLTQELQRAYKLSIYSQTNGNNTTIRRRNIFQAAGHDGYEGAERICELCREIAESQVQIERLRSEQTQGQQYQTLVVVPFRPNIQ